MKILVTGGAGFIGSNLVDGLIAAGHQVSVVDNLSTGKIENINKLATFYQLDINSAKLSTLFQEIQPEVVYHFAAQISIQYSILHPDLDAQTNILGTISVLKACVAAGVRKIVYPSSAAVYGNPRYLGIDEAHGIHPISFYGLSKVTPEYYIRMFSQLYGLTYTINRFANVYGPRQSAEGEGGVVAIFSSRVKHNQRFTVFGDGKQTRDFIFVQDIVQANIADLDEGDNETFNIGTGQKTSVNELIQDIRLIVGKPVAVAYQAPRNGDIVDSYFNIHKATSDLNWAPNYSLSDGLSKMLLKA